MPMVRRNLLYSSELGNAVFSAPLCILLRMQIRGIAAQFKCNGFIHASDTTDAGKQGRFCILFSTDFVFSKSKLPFSSFSSLLAFSFLRTSISWLQHILRTMRAFAKTEQNKNWNKQLCRVLPWKQNVERAYTKLFKYIFFTMETFHPFLPPWNHRLIFVLAV